MAWLVPELDTGCEVKVRAPRSPRITRERGMQPDLVVAPDTALAVLWSLEKSLVGPRAC